MSSPSGLITIALMLALVGGGIFQFVSNMKTKRVKH